MLAPADPARADDTAARDKEDEFVTGRLIVDAWNA